MEIEGMDPNGYTVKYIYDPVLNVIVIDYTVTDSMATKSMKV